MEEVRSALKILTCKPTGKRLLGRPRRKWEGNIRMNLEEIGIFTRNWVDSTKARDYWRVLVNAVIEPPGFIRHGVSYIGPLFQCPLSLSPAETFKFC